MRKILFLIITIATVLFFVACEKEKVPTQKIQKSFEEGVYTGTFTVKYFVEMPESWIQTLTSEALLEFKDGKFYEYSFYKVMLNQSLERILV